MIIKATNKASYLSRIMGVPFWGGRLSETALCYFTHPCIAEFYLVDSFSALQVMCGAAVLIGEAQAPELESFFSFTDIREVFSDNPSLVLNGFDKQALNVMAYTCDQAENLSDLTVCEISPSTLLKHWQEINPLPSCDEIYSDLCMRKNYSNARFFCLEKGGQPVCFAAASGENETECYLSFVFTLPEFRKNGHAKNLLRYIAQLYSDKCVYLVCESSLVDFYKRCGFEKQAEQYLYTQKKEDNNAK